ncbi:hypothetical protein [Spirosoma sp. KNUC1025]|uniref:hypothetical protein n=1 Tax=Spirosoma sp. KNUC1025 TaxID=2894082 RepID=UPI00386BC34E|nr:hypothetical protein LN737_15175 [Spirosoma sp. KNUC1025]
MKKQLLQLPVLIYILTCTVCLAQKKITVDISPYLYQPLYKICQDQSTTFPIYYGTQQYENTPSPKTYFYRVLGSKEQNNCRKEFIEVIDDNKTLTIEGSGVDILKLEQKAPNNNWEFTLRFTDTSTPTVTWKERVNYTANTCDYESTETTYIGHYRKIFSIPTPNKPTLTAAKAVVLFPESTTISSSNCPNTLEGETDYPYNGGSAFGEWTYYCGPTGQPDFTNAARTYSPNNYLVYHSSTGNFKSSTVFSARCNDNGCIGDVSDPLAVGVRYVTPNCPGTDTRYIDNIVKTVRKDYHHYHVETEICQKGPNNPNCTQKIIFDLLISSKRFAAPIASDFAETIVLTDLGNLDTKTPLIGSDLVFKIDASPVKNCETVNLPGYIGMGANLASIAVGPYPYLLNRLASQQTPIANPVAQYIDEQAFSVTNYTKAGHILWPGKTTRFVVDECDRIKIVTIGVGNSFLEDNLAGQVMGVLNVHSGKIIFHNVDERLKVEYNKLPR